MLIKYIKGKYMLVIISLLLIVLIISCSKNYNVKYDRCLNDRISGGLILAGEWNKSCVIDYAYCDLKTKTLTSYNKSKWIVQIDKILYEVYKDKREDGTYIKLVNSKKSNDIIEYNLHDLLENSVNLVLHNNELLYNILNKDNSIYKLNICTLEMEIIKIPGNSRLINLIGTFDNFNIYNNYRLHEQETINKYNTKTKEINEIDKGKNINFSSELGIIVYEKEVDRKNKINVYDFNSNSKYETNLSFNYSSYTSTNARYCQIGNGLIIYSIPRKMNILRQLITMSDYDPDKDYYIFDYIKKETLSKIDFGRNWVSFEKYIP